MDEYLATGISPINLDVVVAYMMIITDTIVQDQLQNANHYLTSWD